MCVHLGGVGGGERETEGARDLQENTWRDKEAARQRASYIYMLFCTSYTYHIHRYNRHVFVFIICIYAYIHICHICMYVSCIYIYIRDTFGQRTNARKSEGGKQRVARETKERSCVAHKLA